MEVEGRRKGRRERGKEGEREGESVCNDTTISGSLPPSLLSPHQ